MMKYLYTILKEELLPGGDWKLTSTIPILWFKYKLDNEKKYFSFITVLYSIIVYFNSISLLVFY